MKVTTIETKHVFAVKLVVNPADRAELCSPDASMPDGLLGGKYMTWFSPDQGFSKFHVHRNCFRAVLTEEPLATCGYLHLN